MTYGNPGALCNPLPGQLSEARQQLDAAEHTIAQLRQERDQQAQRIAELEAEVAKVGQV